jgi:hypothetical protein
MPTSLVLLGIITLVLHLLFTYLLPVPNPPSRYFRPLVATAVIIIVLLLWYVLPVHVG